MKSFIQKLIPIALVLVAIVFLLNLAIDNPYTHKLLRGVINQYASKYTNLRVEFEAVGVSAFPPGIDIYGLRVTSIGDRAKELISCSHASADLSLWSLFLGHPKIGSIVINETSLTYPLPMTPEEILKAGPETSTKAPDVPGFTWPIDFEIPVENVEINNSNFVFRIPGEGELPLLLLSFKGLDLALAQDSRRFFTVNMHADVMDLSIEDAHLVQSAAIDLSLGSNRESIYTTDFKLQSKDMALTPQVKIALQGSQPKQGLAKQLSTSKFVTMVTASADLTGRADLAILGRFLDTDQTSGAVDLDGDFTLTLDPSGVKDPTWSLKSDFKATDGFLDGFRLYDSRGKLEIKPDRIIFSNIEYLRNNNRFADIDGYLSFESGVSYDFHAKTSRLPLSTLLGSVKVPDFDLVDGAIDTQNLRVNGTGKPFALNVTSDLSLSKVFLPILSASRPNRPLPNCALKLNLDVNSERVRFSELSGPCSVDNRDFPIALRGETHFETGIDLKIKGAGGDLEGLSGLIEFGLKGFGDVDVGVKGPYERIEVLTSFSLDRMEFENIPLGFARGTVVFDVASNLLRVADTSLELGPSQRLSTKSSSFKTVEPYTFKTAVDATNITPDFFQSLLTLAPEPIPMRFGVKRLGAEVAGELLKPQTYEGTVSFVLAEANWKDETIFTELGGAISSKNRKITAEDLTYKSGPLSANLAFTYELKADCKQFFSFGLCKQDTLMASIKTNPGDMVAGPSTTGKGYTDQFRHIPFAGRVLQDLDIGGAFDVTAKVEGPLAKLKGNFAGSAKRLTVFGSGVPDLAFRGFVDDGAIDIPMINHSGNSLIGRLHLDPTKDDMPYSWYFKLNRFDLRPLGGRFFFEDPRNYAYLTADWSMKGKFANWWASSGNLDIKDLRIAYVGDVYGNSEKIEVRHSEPIRVDFSESGWMIADKKALNLTGDSVSVRVTTPHNRPPEVLDIQLEGAVDLALLKAFSPSIDSAKGSVVMKGRISGSVEKPKISMNFSDEKINPFQVNEFEPITIGIVDLYPALSNVRLDVDLKESGIFINTFTFNKGSKGRVSLEGGFSFDESSKDSSSLVVNIDNAEFSRYPLPIFKSVNGVVSGNLVLSGYDRIPLDLKGEINIVRARSISNFDIRDKLLESLQKRHVASSVEKIEPFLNLDLKVSADNSIRIKNRNMSLNVSTDLSIAGTNISPIILGQIEIPEGNFEYKREFDISRGSIIFDDPTYPPDPKLDIIGEADVDSYRVQVSISGPSSDPKVTLNADPSIKTDGSPVSKVDILYLISSGRMPKTERTSGTAESTASTEALNLVVGQFEEPIEKLFDLSGQTIIRRVYIDTYTSEEDGRPVPRVNLPIDLGEDLDVILQVDSSRFKVTSEYSLNQNISVNGSYDKSDSTEEQKSKNLTSGDTGVDLKFRFGFP